MCSEIVIPLNRTRGLILAVILRHKSFSFRIKINVTEKSNRVLIREPKKLQNRLLMTTNKHFHQSKFSTFICTVTQKNLHVVNHQSNLIKQQKNLKSDSTKNLSVLALFFIFMHIHLLLHVLFFKSCVLYSSVNLRCSCASVTSCMVFVFLPC